MVTENKGTFYGILYANDIFQDFENHVEAIGFISKSKYVGNDKYGFKFSHRFPIKRSFSKDALNPEPFLPFLGVKEFMSGFSHYLKSRSSLQCASEIKDVDDVELRGLLLDLKKSSWEEHLVGILSDEDNDRLISTDALLVQGWYRNLESRLLKFLPRRVLLEDLLKFVVDGEEVQVISFGSIFKIYYLIQKGILNHEEG